MAGRGGDLGGDLLAESGWGVEPRAHRGAAHREFVQALGGAGDSVDTLLQLVGVAGPFLPHGERDGVLQVGAADLHHVVPLLCLVLDGVLQRPHAGQQVLVDLLDRGDVHGRGEGVVGGLPHVDVVVGMNSRFFDLHIPR
ncbi:hypothetical protein RM764_43630 [Streptomyces sp. DSM 41699]|uniref:Uncharacterized protein n=1 Tax=Streptomyces gibsoniae TaxID=3075529 RepID=A0ABU2U928_9ACTN|nr:hypothetical protein [Streptomyces sp. DSM 41699]MDT0469747.1 hypothetical protein [Streptomyces sp. DSM 41699]